MREQDYLAGNPAWNGSDRMVVISGCSGGGKSTLLQEMALRGYPVYPEPGRQIVKEQLSIGGDGLPWENVEKFVELCVSRALYFFNTARPEGKPALFDRSFLDNIAGCIRLKLPISPYLIEVPKRYRYARRVFMVPPWKELFANDAERRHAFDVAEEEYAGLLDAYQAHGYEVVILPKGTPTERADFLEQQLGYAPSDPSDRAGGSVSAPTTVKPGQIILLNGAPRSGKSSLAAEIQATFEGVWMNLEVDRYMACTPAQYQPGIGLRPGGERPDLEPLVSTLYGALYESIAAHSRLGLNVVVDVGHHDAYSVPRGILGACARRLAGLPVLFVGVRCPLETVMERRRATQRSGGSSASSLDLAPIRRWQEQVHIPGLYDLEVDTSLLSPPQCAEKIRQRLTESPMPSAFQRLETLPRPL